MEYETLSCERTEDGLMVVTLNRPELRNAVNTQMGKDLRSVFLPLRFTPGDLRCIVVTGAGDKAFSSGGDLKERRGMTEEAWRLQHAIFEEAFYAIMDCAVPVIAAVNGVAYAGGCELALACDFIYAARNARFALTEASLGIIPGAGGTQNLPRAVGERRAKELIMSATPFSAEQAYEWGMVNALCEPDALMPTVLTVARRICGNAPISVAQAKKAIHYGLQTDLKTGLMLEVQAYEKVIPSEDRKEGIAAFNEKRPPRFTGR
ncbi:enoyl-CoA hydratase-related protein [Pigmentiphaga soli]|uniref:Enoyl-CoA hydratase-related protein n=1 Tax=Pigmentiphaga soli TaxID=1007095 RepID=A0ABP8HQZ7_9BURK